MYEIHSSTVPGAHVLQFQDGIYITGYVDQHARWTCNICGVKESETGCKHLLEQLRAYAQRYVIVDAAGRISFTESYLNR
jgi:hypothetical protein